MVNSIPPITFKWKVKHPKKSLNQYRNIYNPVYKRWLTKLASRGEKHLKAMLPPPHNSIWNSSYDFATGKLKSTTKYSKAKKRGKDTFRARYGIRNTKRNKKFVMSHVEGKVITPKKRRFLWFYPSKTAKKKVPARKVKIEKKPFMEESVKRTTSDIVDGKVRMR